MLLLLLFINFLFWVSFLFYTSFLILSLFLPLVRIHLHFWSDSVWTRRAETTTRKKFNSALAAAAAAATTLGSCVVIQSNKNPPPLVQPVPIFVSPRLPWIIIISVVQSCSPVPCPVAQCRSVLQHFHNRNQFIITNTKLLLLLFKKKENRICPFVIFWRVPFSLTRVRLRLFSFVVLLISLFFTWRRFNDNMKPVGSSLSVWFVLCAILVASSRPSLAQKGNRLREKSNRFPGIVNWIKKANSLLFRLLIFRCQA